MSPGNSFFIRLCIVSAFFLLAYCFIIWNLWNEQVRFGEDYRDKISRQSIRKIRQPGERGRIYSSDGTVMAGNAPCNKLIFHPSEMRMPGKRENTVNYILNSALNVGHHIGKSSPLTGESVNFHLNKRPALPITVFSDLSVADITAAKEMLPQINGMEILTEPRREYPDGKAACHILGYIIKEDRAEAEDKDDYFYYVSDIKGGQGLEKRFDRSFDLDGLNLKGLRGSPGKSLVRVDHLGYVHEDIDKPAIPEKGNDIILTVDWKAQLAAARTLDGKTGSFIVLNARTGAVLALASSPAFDLNLFIPEIERQEYSRLIKDKSRPFLNRSLMGTYMPGSIIKPLVGLALLENGINIDDKFNCDGGVRIGNTSIKCWNWKSGGHGELDIYGAIENSCNSYFINYGRKIGLDNILKTLKLAGLGSKTGITLPEKEGMIPSRELKLEKLHEKWTEFDTSLLSIGQGMILITPMQAAVYTAAIANGGKLLEPYIVAQLREGDKVVYIRKKEVVRGYLTKNLDRLADIKKGMFLSANGEKGTARKSKNDRIQLYSKTGTAEVGKGENKKNNTWFIGFGENDEELYALSILVENGVSGGSTCAPMAKQFFEEWLK